MNRVTKALSNNSDALLVVFVLGILIVLFVPIPTPLLDFLILPCLSLMYAIWWYIKVLP